MSDDLKFQLRLTLSDEFAQVARNDPGDSSISTLMDILNRHDALLKCQFDAFADYVSEAEANGIENYPLYEWTKTTSKILPSKQNTPSLLRFMSAATRSTRKIRRTR
jgi:hypothetical protein